MTRGRFILETARALSKIAAVRVFFQTPEYPNLGWLGPRASLHGRFDPGAYSLAGLDVEAFTYPALPLLSRALNGVVSGRALTPRVGAFGADVLLGYWVYPDGYAAVRCARRLGLACVVGALGSDIHVRSGLNARMTRRTIGAADALITVSEAMRSTAIERFGADPARTHTIVNGIDTEVFHLRARAPARAAVGIEQDATLLLYVGRLVQAKGLRELVRAFERLAPDMPKLQLALVGNGTMRGELEALVRASGLSGRVHMPGGLDPAHVAQWLAAADVFTLPSWSEGYPNVVVEALACGRPVVATDVGGTGEIVKPANGLLIAPRNTQALAAALSQALGTRWDAEAIAAAMGRSWGDVAAETLATVEQALARRGGRRAA